MVFRAERGQHELVVASRAAGAEDGPRNIDFARRVTIK